ncbi:hypothetical protein Csa_014418 [Cucumis sativus]|nr:hypothetical protein Csa_014418 [Cucumis sativus]
MKAQVSIKNLEGLHEGPHFISSSVHGIRSSCCSYFQPRNGPSFPRTRVRHAPLHAATVSPSLFSSSPPAPPPPKNKVIAAAQAAGLFTVVELPPADMSDVTESSVVGRLAITMRAAMSRYSAPRSPP